MRIKQLGNGGGFDFDKTNSSFLIEYENKYLLFDCGFNVMNKLISMNICEKIDKVYITHMDEDHIGNLKMFIYYRYFVLGGKYTTILAHPEIISLLTKYLKELNKEVIGGEIVSAYMYNLEPIYDNSKLCNDINICCTNTNHGNTKCYGLMISSNKFEITNEQSIFISGDTSASMNIENMVNKYKKYNHISFHDYSYWDFVTRQVHTCETDWNLEYSEDFRKNTIKYHTGDYFNEDWICP